MFLLCLPSFLFFFLLFFFFNDTATTEIYTLSLHDALPISAARPGRGDDSVLDPAQEERGGIGRSVEDRKSTRLNSSHVKISYAVFCLKKKKKKKKQKKIRKKTRKTER